MKKGFLALLAVVTIGFTACKENAAEKVKAENVEVAAERDAQKGNFPEVTFEETEFDFGNIQKNEVVEHTFKFTNTGNAPLIITNARSSCGCTVPVIEKNKPIAPGATSEMVVKYNGSGKNQIVKTVTITANTEKGRETVKIKAFVEVPEGEAVTPAITSKAATK
ncbi:DUF1573 domain-containing protein [Gangjinia marincola]|uniref:DUF1573 domain-containing protein n=1 Tax=Gangjinia marincola TaxID=578463 RepID=A0ABP3XS71_9FLAO